MCLCTVITGNVEVVAIQSNRLNLKAWASSPGSMCDFARLMWGIKSKGTASRRKKPNQKKQPQTKTEQNPNPLSSSCPEQGDRNFIFVFCCLESCKTFALLQLAANPGAGCILHCVRRKKKEKREKEPFGALNGPEGQAQRLERRNCLLSVYLQRL